jgi:hypothetical protein
MAVYVIASVLVAVLAAASMIALAVGVLGALGAPCLLRCARCGHLTLATHEPFCLHCRHPYLTHPVAALHHVQLPHTH